MNVAIYARVSTDAQEEKQTIEHQLTACQEYCTQRGLVVVGEFKDDGVSGAVAFDQRPAGRRLLDDLAADKFGGVVVYCVDRLSRDNEVGIPAYNSLSRLTKGNVQFVIQSFDATPEGKLQFHVFMAIAEYERGVIRRRTMTGVRTKVESGQMYRASVTPYGYRYNTETQQIEVREDTAAVVRRIYDMYLQGSGMRVIAGRLTEEGVPPPSAGTSRANTMGWHHTRVRSILQSPRYVGRGEYNAKVFENGKEITRKIEMPCPPIIDEDTFDRAQKLVSQHSERARRNTKRFYLLQNVLRCGHCDSKYQSVSDGTRAYYRCQRRSEYGQKRGGHAGVKWNWRAEVLDEYVKRVFRDLMSNPKLIIPHIKRRLAAMAAAYETVQSELPIVRQRLTELEAEEGRLLDLAQKGLFKDEKQMLDRLAKVRAEQTSSERHLKRLTQKETPLEEAHEALMALHREATELLVEAQVRDPDGQITFKWPEYTDEQWQRAIRYFVDYVVINDDGTVTFFGSLDTKSPAEAVNLPIPGEGFDVPPPR